MFCYYQRVFWTGVLSEEFFDVSPEMDSLIPSYPSMISPGGEDYLSDSDESFASASETLNYTVKKNRLSLSLSFGWLVGWCHNLISLSFC